MPAPLARFFRAEARLAKAVRPLVNRLVPASPTVVRVRSGPARGLRLVIDPKREKYYWTGTHELAVQEALAELLQPGHSFWDVGAHIGFFTAFASRTVGERGRVHAFEPVSENRRRLAAAIDLNDLGNVDVHDAALAAEPGTGVLRSQGSSLTWSLVGTAGARRPVGCLTLAQAAAELGAPDVMKLDAEGVELAVLRSGLDVLRERAPVVVAELAADEAAELERLAPWYRVEPVGSRHRLLRPR